MDVLTQIWESAFAMAVVMVERLPYIATGVVVFLLFYFLARFVSKIVERSFQSTSLSKNASIVFGRLARWLTILFGFLAAATVIFPMVTPSQILSLLGVGSVAIGFAFRDILQNFLAGILLLLTEPFKIGDQIIVNNYEGTVEQIETRATLIRTYDGRRVVIPNADLFTDSVTVNTAFEMRRSQYDVGIGYGDDIDTAKQLMLEAMRSVSEVVSDPAPEVLTVALADFSVNLRVRWWTQSSQKDVIHIQDKVLTAVKNKLSENGIDMPFPTQVVLFHDQTEETDGDRRQQREGWPAGKDVPEPRKIAQALAQLSESASNGKAHSGS